MAFNPFASFQKNRKFWMATVLLLCMTTFVFCTGVGGDMSDRLLRLFRGRGTAIAEIGGYSLSHTDFTQLKLQRNIANDFMRKCADIAVHNLSERIKEESAKPPSPDKKDEGRQQALTRFAGTRGALLDRLYSKPRFFDGGTKFDELIDFKTWVAQADRLGIQLSEDSVVALVHRDLYQAIAPQQMSQAVHETQRNFQNVGEAFLLKALGEEYRVRMAQLATYEMQPLSYYLRSGESMTDRFPDPSLPDQMRDPMTLAKLWNLYQEKRAEFDVTLIPVSAADFTAKVGEPKESELQALFDKHKGQRYDPVSPAPGFEIPQRAKVEFVMADPTSPAYLGQARAKMLLETMSPLAAAPMQSPMVLASRYAAFSAAEQAALQRTYESLSPSQYRTAGFNELDFVAPMAAWLAKREPSAAAALVGNAAADGRLAFISHLAVGATRYPAELEAGIAFEERRRTPILATVASYAPLGSPYALWGALLATDPAVARSNDLALPLPIVRRDLEEMLQRRTAEGWASAIMLKLKNELSSNTKAEAIQRTLNKYLKKHDLTHGVTEQYVDRFTAGDSKVLRPLRESYLKYVDQINWFEGRDASPEKMLKEKDFARLFFDSEAFSATSNYQIKIWPPAIQPNTNQLRQKGGEAFQRRPEGLSDQMLEEVARLMMNQDPTKPAASLELFSKAEKPALFWKIDTKAAEFPEKLDDVRPRVVEAWKLLKARETVALPLAKKIAQEIEKTGGEFVPETLGKEADKAGSKLITLSGLSPWHTESPGVRREYTSYSLPKGIISYPRDEMVADLLRLPDLKKPLEIKVKDQGSAPAIVKELNDLNQTLFNQVTKDKNPRNKFVQVLTNQPQTTYYVAVVTRPPFANLDEFAQAVTNSSIMRPIFLDSFIPRAQSEQAQAFRAELLQQMRQDLGYWIVDADNSERKSLEADVGGI